MAIVKNDCCSTDNNITGSHCVCVHDIDLCVCMCIILILCVCVCVCVCVCHYGSSLSELLLLAIED